MRRKGKRQRKRVSERERERERGGGEGDAIEARKSSLKLATRADSDAAKGDRVFMSKRAWRRRQEGWKEVVFTRGEYTRETVNNHGFFLFPLFLVFSPSLPFLLSLSLSLSLSLFPPFPLPPPLSGLYPFFLARTQEIVFHCVGKSLKKVQREEFLSDNYALCEVPPRAILLRVYGN